MNIKKMLGYRSSVSLTIVALLVVVGNNAYSKEIINNTTISVEKGNGIELENNKEILTNNGAISTDVNLHGKDNFLYSSIEITNEGNAVLGNVLSNNKKISAGIKLVGGMGNGESSVTENNATASSSGNGIFGDIKTNDGKISTLAQLIGGNATFSGRYNEANASSTRSGNGVNGDVGTNNGDISSVNSLKGGISTSETATASALAQESGNGVRGNVETNNGNILAKLNLEGGESTGTIKAVSEAKASLSGNGVNGQVKTNNGNILANIDVKAGKSTGPITSYSNATALSSGNAVNGGVETNNGMLLSNMNLKSGVASGNEETSSAIYVQQSGNGIYGNLGTNNALIATNVQLETKAHTGEGEYHVERTAATSSGNGIAGDIIMNKGVIKGNITATAGSVTVGHSDQLEITNSGNGVSGNVDEANRGYIAGNITATGGSKNIDTSLLSSTKTLSSGVGFYRTGNGVIVNDGNKFENDGIISGKATLKGGTANLTVATTKENGPTVLSDVTANDSANGIKGNEDTIAININNGHILAKLDSTGGTVTGIEENSRVSASALSNFGVNGVVGNVKINNGLISSEQNAKGGTATNITSERPVSANAYIKNSANGIMGDIVTNTGLISTVSNLVGGEATGSTLNKASTNAYVYAEHSGNGVYGNVTENTGVISGRINAQSGKVIIDGVEKVDYEETVFSGNGIGIDTKITEDITNSGVIKGSQSAIAAWSIEGALNNYGILAGREIFSGGREIIENGNNSGYKQKNLGAIVPVNENNLGIYVKLKSEMNGANATGNIVTDANGNPVIDEVIIGNGGVAAGKQVINGDDGGNVATNGTLHSDTYLKSENLASGKSVIINGTGIEQGAFVVNGDSNLEDSIVNGYNTAAYLGDSSQLTATNTIFNGGGLNGDVAVIRGSAGNNTISILGDSTINGAVDLADGNDELTIGNTAKVNGGLEGGLGNDILNLGTPSVTKSMSNLNLFGKIDGFEKINTNGNVTLFETAKVTGANDITLESGNLLLRIDPTMIADGKIIGHALYENNGVLKTTDGRLVIGLNGAGENAVVSMGGTSIVPGSNTALDYVNTNSLVLEGKVSENGKDIIVSVLGDLPIPPVNPEPPVDPPINPEPPVEPSIAVDSFLYKKLNKVYQSIVTAGEIGELANTTLLEDKTYNESLGGLLTILDQIYANNPYAYTLKSSRDSLKLFEDNLSYLTIKPKKDEMIVQGKAIYTGVKNDSNNSGKNYYGFDAGHRNYKTTTNTVGGLATFEYGLSDKTSVGFVFGGNNQDIKFKGSSKIKGNSLYLGTFAKTDVDNFKFMSGVGYQYTSADADRKISNRYDSFSTGDKYDINSLNVFAEAKYVYNAEHDWTVEPKVRLSYYYIDQDRVDEGYKPGQISMRADKADSNTADVEIGVDFIKSLYLNNGKLKNILSLGVINTIGDKSKELNGYILGKEKDGNKFNIQGVELPKTSGKVSYNLELEQPNGMIYTAGVSLEFAKDYNRNVNATVGIGYKF